MRSLLLIISLITLTFAFDGNRQGFILGGGIGYHFTPFSEDLEDPFQEEGITSFTFSSTGAFTGAHLANGVCTDFFIGAGITPQLMVYYENSVLFSRFDDERSEIDTLGWPNPGPSEVTVGTSRTFLEGATSIGGRYYFKEEAKSPFVSASAGIAVTKDQTFNVASKGFIGPALGLGVGYEFYKHLSGELQLQFGYTTDSDDTVKHRFLGIQILFTSIAY